MPVTLKLVLTLETKTASGISKFEEKRTATIDLYDLAANQRVQFEAVIREQLDAKAEDAADVLMASAGPTLRDAQAKCNAWHREQHDEAQARLPGEPAEEKPKARSKSLPKADEPTNP